MSRALSTEERALWRRVTADIRREMPTGDEPPLLLATPKNPRPAAVAPVPLPVVRRSAPSATLDGRWDRQLANGDVLPDRVVDLHGCTLEAAHQRALSALESAVREGDRIVVLVTGKPPKSGSSRLDAPLRGIIRASISDWIAASPVARHIAAIRPAHHRHGGAGAIYVVLRRGNRFLA
jgi:DNA-nicking Smr family endonuclease